MRLEGQVCSLSPAMTLKHLGVKQDSQFYWFHSDVCRHGLFHTDSIEDLKRNSDKPFNYQAWSAFTVVELGLLLPNSIEYKCGDAGNFETFRSCELSFIKNYENVWVGMYIDRPKDYVLAGLYNKREADARAELLIKIIREGLITPTQEDNDER